MKNIIRVGKGVDAMKYKRELDFLNALLMIFEASIDDYQVSKNKIKGTIIWRDEEEKQEFSYEIKEEKLTKQKKQLCEFLVRYKLIQGDKITIDEKELSVKLTKELKCTLSEAEEIINSLCETEIRMLDDGEETDSLFIHF